MEHRADARGLPHVEEAERGIRREAGEIRLHLRTSREVGEAHGDEREQQRPQRDETRAPRTLVLHHRPLGGEQQAGEHRRVLLAEQPDGVQQREQRDVAGAHLAIAPAAQVPARRRDEAESDQQLRLPHHVPRHFHVHRMHGERRGGEPGTRRRQERERNPVHGERRGHGEEDVGEMEHPRRAVSDDPFHGERQDQHRAVAIATILRRPVALREVAPEPVQRVHPLVHQDHVPIVVREIVSDARDAGRECQDRDARGEKPAASRVGHASRLNFRMCQKAAMPSFQLIFFPSAYVRPA